MFHVPSLHEDGFFALNAEKVRPWEVRKALFPFSLIIVYQEGNLQAVDPPPYAQPPGDDFETGQKPGCPVGFSYEEPGRQAAV